MKIFLFLIIILFSCNKENTIDNNPNVTSIYDDPLYLDKDIFLPGTMEKGFITAKKNGLDWKSSAEGFLYTPENDVRLAISSYTFNYLNYERESLSFSNFPLSVKKYIPTFLGKNYDTNKYIRSSFYRLAGDGDVIADLPKMLVDTTVSTNYFELISLDTVANVLEARFDISLRSNKNSPHYKDEKIRFSDGLIKVKLSRE
jgi:hypothetical protein